ncbi:non-specific lipid transfer protein GPI-anchored 9-like [Macadamia integrifolia]|uniref:non-specific lipid transfer protein GPI-anchored 9-like n=1 Tax=Macadamia integrifolia TaxID=60698 RepID=UPI001C500A22|nr:non-specific lipid transfer protein GPI-anchored 9-like [Macadamia integrifolia]
MGNWAMVVLAILMVTATVRVAEGQGSGSTPSCAAALVPCADYLNSTKPPASCCTPLRQAVATQLKCLCNLLNDTSLFNSLHINMTQALELPKYCGVNDTTTACRKFSALSPSSADTTTTTTTPPPPGATGNGVGKLPWNGMSCLLVLLAFMEVIRDFSVL